MNAMKLTGKSLALFFAAGIAAAALSACGDEKTDEPAKTDTTVQTSAQQPDAQQKSSDQAQAGENDIGAMDMKPATEAEVLEILAFLPDPLATIDGKPLPRKTVTDDIVSQGIPAEFLRSIGEERLRQAMKSDIEKIVKSRLMLKLAEDAGYKPSAEFVAQKMKEELEALPEEEQTLVKKEIEEDYKKSLDEYIKEESQDKELQEMVAVRRYRNTEFLDKAKKEVSDDDINKFYEDHVAGVTVAHILIQLDADEADADKADADAKTKIDAIYEELIKDPSQFETIAQDKSDCPSKVDGGKLPSFAKDGAMLDGAGGMDETFAAAAFTIEKEGQITKPFKTRFGYHIVKLLDRNPEGVPPLDKVKDRIAGIIAADKAQDELEKTLDEALKKYAKINDFVPAKEEKPEAE